MLLSDWKLAMLALLLFLLFDSKGALIAAFADAARGCYDHADLGVTV